jgi:hypothetical protein
LVVRAFMRACAFECLHPHATKACKRSAFVRACARAYGACAMRASHCGRDCASWQARCPAVELVETARQGQQRLAALSARPIIPGGTVAGLGCSNLDARRIGSAARGMQMPRDGSLLSLQLYGRPPAQQVRRALGGMRLVARGSWWYAARCNALYAARCALNVARCVLPLLHAASLTASHLQRVGEPPCGCTAVAGRDETCTLLMLSAALHAANCAKSDRVACCSMC